MFRRTRGAGTLLTALVAVAITIPATAFGIHQFTDVPDSNPFHADIDALADSGVTTGCGTGIYCPKDFVTREQMAAFMNRLGALAPSKTPVVNADKLDGLDSSDFVQPTGEIVVTGNLHDWITRWGGAVVNHSVTSWTDVSHTGAGSSVVGITPTLPVALYGRALRLTSMELCYQASATAQLTLVVLTAIVHSTGPVGFTEIIQDSTDRTDTTCRTWTPTTPHTFGPDDGGLSLGLQVTWSGTATFRLGRASFVLEPADAAFGS